MSEKVNIIIVKPVLKDDEMEEIEGEIKKSIISILKKEIINKNK
ncbi:MAG: hypothetical protein N4A57_12450 [Anaeromicrobium sp.]|jgi:hypothetical protein|nr:hypothetical protein [Anaeromicrobium sp.]MCT4595062.1 hypothetical protein [Anaeromicrobium sp.]